MRTGANPSATLPGAFRWPRCQRRINASFAITCSLAGAEERRRPKQGARGTAASYRCEGVRAGMTTGTLARGEAGGMRNDKLARAPA